MLHSQIQTAVSLVFPPQCMGCGALTEASGGLCASCWSQTQFITGTICESCGAPLPGEADGYRLDCDDCMANPRPWQRGRSALLYAGRGRRLVLALKHGDRTELSEMAAQWLHRAARPLLAGNPLLCPVPLHWTRLLRRRYNQSALLAAALARRGGLAQCPDLLRRIRLTPSLEGKSRSERMRLLGEAIAVHPRHRGLLEGRAVLIVDDVMTSGATLGACATACLEAGAAEVRVAVLARVTRA